MEWWIINDELIFHPLSIIGFLDCLWFLDRFRKTYSGPEDWHAFIRQLFFFFTGNPLPPVKSIFQIFQRPMILALSKLLFQYINIPEGNINKLQEKENNTFLHCLNGGFISYKALC